MYYICSLYNIYVIKESQAMTNFSIFPFNYFSNYSKQK